MIKGQDETCAQVTYDDSGDGGNPLGDLTEEDIVLLDGDYH